MNEGILSHVGQAVGNTPLVALNRIAPALAGRVAVKLEFFSPGGSVKDRPAWAILEAAERSGELRRGQRVVELTSGNMGAGLACACAVKGYRFIAVMSAGNTPERRQMIRAFGAEVVVVPQARGGKPGQGVSGADLAQVETKTRELIRKWKAFRPNQFANPNAVLAHQMSTGPEIWAQTQGRVSHFCAMVGSGSTLIGVAKALKAKNPRIQTYAVEPAKARFLAGLHARPARHALQGGGYALRPEIYDETVVDGHLGITDAQAIRTARLLASKEGICCGITSGANVAAALKLAAGARRGCLIVTIICDTGLKYLSSGLYPAG